MDLGAEKREAGLREIGSLIVIHTGGTATGGTRIVGAAMVVTEGDPADPIVTHSEKRKGAL